MLEKNGTYYHIKCKKGDVGRYVLLPGDPFRTDRIAGYLEHPVLVAHNREHKTWTGTLLGEAVSVTSTGMGCPSTAIALEELIACGADTFIRVGTAGRISDLAKDERTLGVVNTAAVREEGTTKQYVPVEFPAVANRQVVDALITAAKRREAPFVEGITLSKDSFYSYVFPDTVPVSDGMKARQEIWKRAGVVSTEMEAAAIFVISSVRNCRSGGIMAFSDCKDVDSAVDLAIQIACDALRTLIQSDRALGPSRPA